MKTKQSIFACISIGITLLLASCKSGDGPLLVNTSGATVQIVVLSADGSAFNGSIADHDAVWAGKPHAEVRSVEIVTAHGRYVLEGEELQKPYGKDGTTAFIIDSSGVRKLTLDEARILMRAH